MYKKCIKFKLIKFNLKKLTQYFQKLTASATN